MPTRRLTTTGVALVAALSVAITACGQTPATDPVRPGGASAAAPSTAPADPREELTAGARKLNEDSVRVRMDSLMMTGGGVMDPRTKTADMTLTVMLEEFRMINVGDDAYLRSGDSSEKWWHVNTAELPPGSQFNVMPNGDPGGVNKLVKSIGEIRRTGDRAFAGTLDYTRTMSADKNIQALGDKAKAVPFTAKIDEQGRLVEIVLDTSVISPLLGKLTTTYSDFGTPVVVRRPAASETEEAPEALIKAVGA